MYSLNLLLVRTFVRVGALDPPDDEVQINRDYLIVGRNDPDLIIFFNVNNIAILTLERDVTFNGELRIILLSIISL